MSGFALALATWGPVILRCLPQIIRVGQDLYALWCSMRGTRQQNDAVLRAMKLLNRHQDDIDRLLQDPQQKRDLVQGLAILMNRINEHDTREAGACGNNTTTSSYPSRPTAPNSDGDSGASSFSKPSTKGSSWKACDVCRCEYNSSDKRPTILICGHTFCRECLREILRRGSLLCPTCRTHETRPLASLPPNTGLIRVLEEEDDEGDDSCCSNSGGSGSGGGGGECNGMPLSYEQQIQYAIFLSQQQAQNQGAAYVARSWREVEEAEDERLARALQDSEIFEASRLCAQRQWAEGDDGALNPPDKKKEACGACASDTSGEEEASLASASQTSEEEEAISLQLAFELQQQEMERMQRLCGSSSSSDGGCDWMKDYQNFFGPSLCCPVEEHQQKTMQGEENAEDRREKQQDQDEEDGATCHSRSEDSGAICYSGSEEGVLCHSRSEDGAICHSRSEEDGATCCSRSKEDEGKKEDDGQEECGKKCYEDDCGKGVLEKECLALLKGEEDLLIQMAIRLSLEQQDACTAISAKE